MMSQSQGCSQEKSPSGCLVSPGSSSKGGTGAPCKLHSAPSAAGIWGKRLGAQWELSKVASPAQLLGALAPHGWGCHHWPGCWEQESLRDKAVETGELEGHGCGERTGCGTWLLGTGELGGCGNRGQTSFGG